MSDLSESQIRSFQQARGLSVTGLVDEVTARALEEAQWKLGDRSLGLQEPPLVHGDDVAALQSRLTEMGFDCGRVDGLYGPRTELAVKDFQKSVGATIDGKCGPATIIALIRLTKSVSGGAPSVLRESANQKNRGPALANKTIVLNPDGDDSLARIASKMNVATPVDRKIKRHTTNLLVVITNLRNRALLGVKNTPRNNNRTKIQTGSTSGRILVLEVTLI